MSVESTAVLEMPAPVDEVTTCEAEVIEAHEPDHVADAIKALWIARKRTTDTAEMKYRETVRAVVAAECPAGRDLAKAIDAAGKTDTEFESDCRRHARRVELRRQIDAHPKDTVMRADLEKELRNTADDARQSELAAAQQEFSDLYGKSGKLNTEVEHEKSMIEICRRELDRRNNPELREDKQRQIEEDIASRESRIAALTAEREALLPAIDTARAREKAAHEATLEV